MTTDEKVKIGYWYTYCCQEDLSIIETEEERQMVQDELDDGNEIGIMVWKTDNEVKKFYKDEPDYPEILEKIKNEVTRGK
jgi:hypothetical protein